VERRGCLSHVPSREFTADTNTEGGEDMRIGEIRVRLLRVMQYASFVTFGASVMTAVKIYNLSWWLLPIGVIPFIVLYWIDGKIVRGEQSYFNDNNEALQKLIKAVERLEKK
jgi:hypothetical protein